MLVLLVAAAPLFSQTADSRPASAENQPFTVRVSSFGFDTAPALQAAVNKVAAHGGGVVQLEPGIYPLQQAVSLANIHDVSVVGYGARLRAAHKMTVIHGYLIWIQDSDRIQIRGIAFDGDSVSRGFANNAHSINLNWSRDVLVSDCSFKNAVCDDIFMWGGANPPDADRICKRIQITHCAFDNANRNAISVVNAANVRIDHNLIQNVRHNDPRAGVDIEPNFGDPPNVAHHIQIDNNRIVNTAGDALVSRRVAAPSDIWIIGNTIERCDYGIGNEATNCDIEWNTIIDSPTFAIAAGNGGSGTIQNNTIIRCRQAIIADKEHVVKSNTIK